MNQILFALEHDIFIPRSIIYVKEFVFEDNTNRDKYLIVLHRAENHVFFLHSLTTSKIKVPPDKMNHGCTNSPYLSFYMFEAGRVIGESNFYFDFPTFIHFNNNVRKNSVQDFTSHFSDNLIYKIDDLSISEYKRLIKCISGSKHIPQKIKHIFIALKEKLANS